MPQATTVHFPVYANIPKLDPLTKRAIPEPEPEVRDISKYEYVVIPDLDIFGAAHQGVSINGVKFERGQTYFIAPEFAAEVKRLLATGLKADMRILQAQPDVKSVREQSQYGTPSPGSTFERN